MRHGGRRPSAVNPRYEKFLSPRTLRLAVSRPVLVILRVRDDGRGDVRREYQRRVAAFENSRSSRELSDVDGRSGRRGRSTHRGRRRTN